MKRKMWKVVCMLACLVFSFAFGLDVHATGNELKDEMSAEGLVPKVIVTHYDMEGEVSPGEKVTLKATIKNMSKYLTATDIVCYLYFPDGGFYYQNGVSNEIFVQELKPGEKTEIEYKLIVAETYTRDMAILQLDVDYFGNGHANVTTAHITPAVFQESELDIELLSVAERIEEGTELLISTQYSNTGVKDLSNVVLQVAGAVEGGKQNIPLGELGSGETRTDEVSIALTGSGMRQITVKLLCRDTNAHWYYSEPHPFKVEIATGILRTNEADDGLAEQLSQPFYTVLVVVAVIGIAIVAVFAISELRSKKKGGKN